MGEQFNYPEALREAVDDWQIEVIQIFRLLDLECDGSLPRDAAVHAMSLIGLNGEEHFHPSRKTVSLKMFIAAVQQERERNSDPAERCKYVFRLISDPVKNVITKDSLRKFFTLFGHTPEERFCEDLILEFDRGNYDKTEVTLEEWIVFCRINKVTL